MRKTALLLALILVVTLLGGCGKANDTDTSFALTESVVDTESDESTSEKSTGIPVTGDGSRKFNESIPSCLGKTCREIKADFGEITDVSYYEGGIVFLFENDNGYFNFGDDDSLDWKNTPKGSVGEIPSDEDGLIILETAPMPKDDAVCSNICYVKPYKIFENIPESISTTELTKDYGLTFLTAEYMDYFGEKFATFEYKNKYSVTIRVTKDNIIDADSYILWVNTLN